MKRIRAVLLLLALTLTLGGCGVGADGAADDTTADPAKTETERVGDVADIAPEPDAAPLREDKSIYSDTSELSEVVTMYLTVREGNAEDSTNHTWTEVNTYDTYYYSENKIDRYACEAILQVGDENGPVEGEFGYGETVPNATVCVRGQTSSRNAQKSYKVRIKDGKGTYKDMQTIPLNKYMGDSLRYRNKLAFDLMRSVPQMTAIRTQFVHLYVKDETRGGSGIFEDYGLYIRLEQINKTYLENHGLDKKGSLYKFVFFEFETYEPVMLAEDDPRYDEWAFQKYLKIKGDTHNEKLRKMIAAVNDRTIPIEQIVSQYFDVENISYFLAFHILIGNIDVGARNEYLYSPLNSDKWYFLSWDCDACFKSTENKMRNRVDGQSWERGLTQFTNLVLFNRMFRVKEYRDALINAVNDLRDNYLDPQMINEHIDIYKDIVIQYLQREPDSIHWDSSQELFEYYSDSVNAEIEENYQYFLYSLNLPWPFFAWLPEKTPDGDLYIGWGNSYDLDLEDITYKCIIADDTAFQNVLFEQDGIRIPGVYCDLQLSPGRYYLRVVATNESGYSQDCFDYYTESGYGKRYGCMAFEVLDDGTFKQIANAE